MIANHHKIRTVVLGLLFGLSLFGCEKKEVSSKTEVKDKLFGGTEVKKTEVTTQGDKAQVKETKTEVNQEGTKVKTEVTTKGNEIK
jgi:translation initiation factor 1 (eIF-1/SUI1)